MADDAASKFGPLKGIPEVRVGMKRMKEPEYLDYDVRGKGYFERLCFNTGVAYGVGFCVGGLYGVATTPRTVHSNRFRIVLNQVLNGLSKNGARWGNSLGIIAMMYTSFESISYNFYFEERLGAPIITPLFAGGATGFMYTCTRGSWRPIALATSGGACVAGFYWMAGRYLMR